MEDPTRRPPDAIERWILVITGATALVAQLVQLAAALRLLVDRP